MKKNFRKLFLFMAVVIMAVVCTVISVSALDSEGECGENVYYTYNETTGELVISGSGEMYGYDDSEFDFSPFYDSQIRSVVINEGITKIGSNVFCCCESIEKVVIAQSVTTIDYCAFSSCGSLTEITIPDGVITIGFGAFSYCESLEKVVIPGSVTTIDEDAFRGCRSLESAIIPDGVTVIGWEAFSGCSSLESVVIPGSVTTIEEGAFSECTSLESVIIPSSVTTIGRGAFSGCTSLTSITLPFIGESLNSTDNTQFGFIFGSYHYNYNMENVPDSLKKVVITAPCKEIADFAFHGCENLESITIAVGAEKIGCYAFSDCVNLSEITIPDSITSIGDNAFSSTEYYNNIYNWENKALYINNHLISVMKTVTSFNIRKNTKTIADGAFYFCENLKSVTIPDGVVSIGDSTFYYCTDLESVTIPNSVTSIGDSAFGYCADLKSITIPDKVTSIGNQTFYYCADLKSITLGKGVKSIGDEAFYECYELSKITIPDGVTSIGESAFYNCENLKSITIPDSVTSIGESAFRACNKLTNVKIGKGVKTLSREMFSCCLALKSITIPDGVTSIDDSVFYSCDSLTSIVIPVSLTLVENEAFHNTNLKYVFYGGTETQRKNIKISVDSNDGLFDSVWHYKATGHTNKSVTTKATLTKDGKIGTVCSVCGYSSTTPVYYPKTIILSATSYTYDGKVKTPSVTVKDSKGNTLTKDKHYTVSYSGGRKLMGKYTVTVKFIGDRTGTKTLDFTIAPKAVTGLKVTQSSSAIKLTWNKMSGVTGYRVFKYDSKTKSYVKMKDVTGTSLAISNPSAGVKYRFKVRAYVKSGGTTIWGNYSSVCEVVIKLATPSLKVTSTGKGLVTLNWTDVKGENGYDIYYSTKKNSGFKKYATIKSDVKKIILADFKSGKTYYFRVRAYVNTSGGTIYSGYKTVGVKVK